MKLQQLTIHNIASIEDAIIDFEAQPKYSKVGWNTDARRNQGRKC